MSDKNQPVQVEFLIQKLYNKDISFESPASPEVFSGKWTPKANIEVNSESNKLSDDVYEVDLKLTLKAENGEKTAFLIEMTQTGIFSISGVEQDQLGHLLGSYCPSILFPYARNSISSMVQRGGFPEVNIAPIHFDQLYAQNTAQNK